MQDNILQIIPKEGGKYKVVPWLKGAMKSNSDYDLDVLGMINT